MANAFRFTTSWTAILSLGAALTLTLGVGPAWSHPSDDPAAAKPPKKGPAKPQPAVEVPNFHGLLIPSGAAFRGPAPGGKGRIVTATYKRGRTLVEAALRKLLIGQGWTLKADTRSPRGTVRLTVERKGHTVKISVTGTDAQAALILTR